MTGTQARPSIQEGSNETSKGLLGCNSWWCNFVLFSVSVIFPSLALFKKLGFLPLLIFAGASSFGLFLLLRYVLPWLSPRLTTRVCVIGVLFSLAGLTAAHYWIYPQILHDGGFKLFGIQFGVSDSNDAFVATWKAMFQGQYPYYAKSFLGNPISPMPGALLLAFPFYSLGVTSFQNVFWLGVFWAGLGFYTKSFRTSSILFLTVLAFCPNIWYQIVVAGDYATNGTYVLLSAVGLYLSARSQCSRKLSIFLAVCLGIALSSRLNFLLILPALFFPMIRQSGLRNTLVHFVVIGVTLAAVTLPFYFYDPTGFSPLHTTSKLEMQGGFRYAAQIFFLAGLVLSSILGAFGKDNGNPEKISGWFYFGQAFVIFGAFLMTSIVRKEPAMWYPHFALLCLPFGVFAFGPALFREAIKAPEFRAES